MSSSFKKYGVTKTAIVASAFAVAAIFGAYAVFGSLTTPYAVKLNPASASVESSGAWVEDSSAWALFDRDTATAYAPASSPGRVMVTLPTAVDISAIKVYGSASYSLTVYDGSSGSWTPVPGLEAIALKSQSSAWNAFSPTSSLHTNKLMLEFTTAGGNASGVKEIEIWGAEAGDPAISLKAVKTSVDAKAVLAATPRPAHIVELDAAPQTIDVPADGNTHNITFTLNLDPKLIKRAYFYYDAYNADYPIIPEKRINGLSWTGGLVPSSTDIPDWKSHVEEVNPSWLVKGVNKIEFRNQNMTTDPASYFIRDAKVIVELENGWNLLSTVTGTSENAAHSGEAAFDGDLTTYFELKSTHTLDLKTDRTVQPDAIRLNLWSAAGTPCGSLSLQYLQGTQWKNFASGGTIDMATLKDGWNEIKVPAVVSTDTIRLTIQVTPDRKRKEATVGGINEVELIASPVGSWTSQGLIVNYPQNGQYFNRTAYIQGFVDPASNPSGTAQIAIEGKTLSNPDGAFSISLSKDETSFATQNDNDPWQTVVTATYPDGTQLSQTVVLNKNILNNSPATSNSGQASVSQKEKFSEKVIPGQAKTIKYKGVTLDIPADAVDRETEITIIPLSDADLARFNPGMINVTFPDAGYRFLPQGMKFKKAIKISFGYSKTLFATGQADNEVYMYYYDVSLLRWQRLTRVKVDATVSQVTSESDHFTDIINSTLVVPEHPEALTYNPNSIKDIKAADPSANIDLIEPPNANNKGTAELSYPIEIPKGRGAFTPDLRVIYSSSNENEWMGLGWNIPIPSIQVDTRWGVPAYNKDNETESYLFAGQVLAPVFKRFDDPPVQRMTDRRFTKRVEGDFMKIIRKGNGPKNYSWEITDKSGVKYYYGLTPQARLASYQTGTENIFQWFLEKVVDSNGNVTTYSYYTDTKQKYLSSSPDLTNQAQFSLSGENWVHIYPDTITYTGNEKTGASAQYSVQFVRDAGNRQDVVIGGRSGFKTALRFRLDSVVVKFKDKTIRSYQMTYMEGDFYKSLLQKITAKGANNGELYSHAFDYYHSGSDGIAKAFSDSVKWSTSDSGVLTKTEEDASARNFYKGQSYVPERAWSRGRVTGYVNADSTTTSKFLDLNGDGLPDIVFDNGAVLYNLGGPEGQRLFHNEVPVAGLPAIEKEIRRTDTSGMANYIGIGSYWDDMAYTTTKSCATMLDMNGDGFIDAAVGTDVYFNQPQSDNRNKFTKASNWSFSSSATVTAIDNFRKEHLHLVDPVRKWTAPFSGNIKITGSIQKKKREDAKQTTDPDGDGLTLYVYRENSEIGHLTIAQGDYTAHLIGEITGNAGSDNIELLNVQQGERVYFRMNSIDNGENDEVVFDPAVSYTASGNQTASELQTLKDANGRLLYAYQASTDFSLADTPKIVWMSWYTGTFTLSGKITKLSTADDVRITIKRSTNADYNVWDSVYKEYDLAANEEQTIDLSETVQTTAGERFLISVESDRGVVDPARLSFTAGAVYTEVVSCGWSKGYKPQYACNKIPITDPDAKDKTGTLLYRFSLPVNYPIVYTIPKASNSTWIAPYDGKIEVVGGVWRTGWSGAFTAYIMGVNKLYWKQAVPLSTGDAYSHDVVLDVSQGDQIFFEIHSDNPVDGSASWSPQINYVQYCSVDPSTGQRVCNPVGSDNQMTYNPTVQYYYNDPNQGKEPFGGGFRQWYYGEWNGYYAWDQSKIVVRTPVDDHDDVYAYFIRMVPESGGTPYSGGLPVWTIDEDRSFISANGLSSSRLGDSDMGSACAPGGVLRQSTGTNQNVSGSFWIGGINRSHGNTDTQIELIDMNGDGYPDLVTPDHVILSDGKTGLKADGAAPGRFRTNYNDNTGYNLNVGGTVNAISSGGKSLMAAITSPPGNYKIPTSWWDLLGVSAGYVRGRSTTKADLIDINGDGLPDLVYQGDPTALKLEENVTTLTVRLNLGDHFGEEEQWYLPGDAKIRDGGTRTLNVNLGVDLMGIAGASYGIALNVTKTEREMIDINGDGLPDMVSKNSDDDYMVVRINKGGSFGEEEHWPIPSWLISPPQRRGDLQLWTFLLGIQTSSYYLDEIMFQNDTLTNTTTETDSHGWFLNGAIPQFTGPFWENPTFLIRGKDETSSNNGFKSQIDFVDIDGDGLPDHIMKANTYYDVEVKRNLSGKANMLKAVHRPLGGSFTLDYKRKGNKVDYTNSTQIVDMPKSYWVVSDVKLSSGMTQTYETTFNYDSGYYNRAEREFYGFHKVTETRGIGSDTASVVRTYLNQDYYLKGLLAGSETRAGSIADIKNIQNSQNPIYVSTMNDYQTRPGADTASQFPYLTKTTNNFYNVQAQTLAKSTSQEYIAYDDHGNITDYVDNGDGKSGNKVIVKIQFMQSNDDEYLWDKPTNIDVKDANNQLYRNRSAKYQPGTGNMTDLWVLVDQGKNAHWVMTYYPDGNLWTMTYPAGDPGFNKYTQGYMLTYTYDPDVSIYVTGISDSFGYGSSAQYDPSFGQPLLTKDINGNYRVNTYDEFGRMTAVYGPYAVNNGGAPVCPPTISFEYSVPTNMIGGVSVAEVPATALTKNRADSALGCTSSTIRTATFADGLKRIISTKKDATINGVDGVVVSGAVEFDSLGRIVKQGQPVPGIAELSVYENVTVQYPTLLAYDTLDRTVTVKTPDSNSTTGYAVTTTNYGYGDSPDGTGTMFLTQVIDPQNHSKESYKDVHDRIHAVVEHNTINGSPVDIATTYAYDIVNEIMSVTDAKLNKTAITYDLAGHRLTINNPDTGLTTYTYDANGNVTTKETANLKKGAKLIKYQYEYNRLVEIQYPDSPHVFYAYGNPNETGDAHGNLAGRIKQVTDESGMELRYYGRLGETTKELRQINATNNPVAKILFETDYVFDSFGRMLRMTYPDGEVLSYGYDHGGLLNLATGVKRGNYYHYINSLYYDEFGQRKNITYGNGVTTTYTYYPSARRLSHLTSVEPTKGRTIQDISYTYDLVGNIGDIYNTAPVPTGGEIGGPTDHHYTYDDLYQLITANGSHTPAPGKLTTYTNALNYDTIGNIGRKLQTHLIISTNNSQAPAETNYDMSYKYAGTQPHAVTDAGDKLYTYDLDGNMTGWTSKTTNAKRIISWNEENRVTNITDNGNGTSFLYDDQGERVTKRGGGNETVYVNRFYAVKNGDLGTKHIFANETRVCTKLEKDGGSIQSGIPGANAFNVSQGLQNALQQGGNINHQPPKIGIYRRLPGGTSGTGTNPPMEKFEFFYHGDHLGSSNFITDDAGQVYQDLEYFPYGETWVEDGGSGQMPMYRFTGKELDPETGLYYYGARYYDPVLSRWVSADPALSNYIDGKPSGGVFLPSNLWFYSYTANNPVIYKDPNGKFRIRNDWTLDVMDTAQNLNSMAYQGMSSAWNEGNYGQAAVGAVLWLANGINLDVSFVVQGLLTPVNAVPKYAYGMYTGNYGESQVAGAELLLSAVFLKLSLPPEAPKAPAATTAASAATASTARSLENPSSLRGASAEEVKNLIPKDWKMRPMRTGQGEIYEMPGTRGSDIVQISRGNPRSPDPLHQGPYVKISKGGQTERVPLAGNPTLE